LKRQDSYAALVNAVRNVESRFEPTSGGAIRNTSEAEKSAPLAAAETGLSGRGATGLLVYRINRTRKAMTSKERLVLTQRLRGVDRTSDVGAVRQQDVISISSIVMQPRRCPTERNPETIGRRRSQPEPSRSCLAEVTGPCRVRRRAGGDHRHVRIRKGQCSEPEDIGYYSVDNLPLT
jgi:hypothetical protein